ncbi:MAG: permease-like cell division protein FtsX [Evtepia sp.]
MKTRIMGYHLREGFWSIFSHGLMSFAAISMIVACLLIMGSFSLVAINVDNNLRDLENKNEFLAYIDENLSTEEAQALQSEIEAIDNVDSVIFVTREEAMEEFRADKDDQTLFQDLPQEVFRHRFRIHMVDLKQMAETVAAVEKVDGIVKTRAEMDLAEGFVTLRNVATALALILIVMLVVISLFIIANTIKLATFTRREEIAIMKMCGATDWFIRWPFIVEGIILGVVGAAVAFGLQWGVYSLITTAIAEAGTMSIVAITPFANMALNVALTFLAAGFTIGAGGSVMAIRKFLRV